MKYLTVTILLISLTAHIEAQIRSFSAISTTNKSITSVLVNRVEPAYEQQVEKSSFALTSSALRHAAIYTKTVTISYQLASLSTLEWAIVRNRAAGILDSHDFLTLINLGVFTDLISLSSDDFVPMSAYAPLNIRLNFNYAGRTTPAYFHTQGFTFTDNGKVINTKTFQITR
jgi:hypothetical protein